MGSNSNEELDMSESEKGDYTKRLYNQLKVGKYKIIKNTNNTFKCLFLVKTRKSRHFSSKSFLNMPLE